MAEIRLRGFTLFEFAVVILAISILSGLLLIRVLPMIGQAEHVAFIYTERQLKSALLLEAAERIARGDSRSLPALAGQNPIDLLLEPPVNYVGPLQGADLASLPRRSWAFDPVSGHLVYRPGRQARFDSLAGPGDRIEFRVQFAYQDRDGDGAYSAVTDNFDGMRLEPVYPFAWTR